MAKDKRKPTYDFTVQEWDQNLIDNLKSWENNVIYLTVSEEIGEKEGKKHLQCKVKFKYKKSWESVKKLMGGAHIEESIIEDDIYCKKLDSIPVIRIDHRHQGSRSDINNLIKDAIDGDTPKTLLKKHGGTYLRYNKHVDSIKYKLIDRRTTKPRVEWYYGPTKTGKTTKAFEENPGAYFKSLDKWWDDYSGQDVVVIDEIRPDSFDYAYLLRLTDRYPFRVEYKGGTCEFNSKKIIFTSSKHPSHFSTDNEDHQQFMRRIDYVHRMSIEVE